MLGSSSFKSDVLSEKFSSLWLCLLREGGCAASDEYLQLKP